MQYIVVYGNPAEGFDFCGPFASFEEAEGWARKVDGIKYNTEQGDNWYITTLTAP
jgi:hypothetical protein